MNKLPKILSIILALVIAQPCFAQNEAHQRIRSVPVVVCGQTNFQVCGNPFIIAGGTAGNVQSFAMPERYVIGQVSFQCVTDGLNAFYKILNTDVANCEIKSCAPGKVMICDNTIPVEQPAKYGDVVRVKIPDDLIDHTRTTASPTISAQCAGSDGAVNYKLVKNGGISSCNIFKCPPATLDACGSPVVIDVPMPMGSVIDATTQNNQPVRVQCLGSLNGAPHYVISDYTCGN